MRQTQSNNPDIVQLQSAMNDQFAQLRQIDILNGLRLTSIALTSAAVTNVNHKLGRQALGYFVTSASAGALIWNDTLTESVIPLHTSADITVDLWVF
jgi:hypothetical protein